jgi:hypothetical protein
LSIYAGRTFGAENAEIMDYVHFNGNQTLINSPRGAMNSFKLLPYYDHSTLDGYIEGHLEHNFKGFFLGKIPFVKELKFEEITSVNYLIQENDFRYLEYSIGISNIGWSLFRLFRVEYTWAFENNKSLRQGITIGIGL